MPAKTPPPRKKALRGDPAPISGTQLGSVTPRSRRTKTPQPIQAYDISERVERQALIQPYQRGPKDPLSRPLRIYTLDPSVSDRLGGVATVLVPYEKLEPGPCSSLLQVKWEGAPEAWANDGVNLDEPSLLLSSGIAPTPANGRFHLQMVYAVCSITYATFKRALGRDIAWATPQLSESGPLRLVVRPFVQGRNAGYSREAGDLSFGWFEAEDKPAGFIVPGGLISTALSHDIIVHETTHALLDGLRSAFAEPTNIDVLAFHEGFADLVALFLHFSYPEMVEQAMREARGAFQGGSILTDIAREFGYARSNGNRAAALRSGVDVDGIASFDSDVIPSKNTMPKTYDDGKHECHALGSVLVSAVFEAFTTIVKRKSDRLFRIAGIDQQAEGRPALSEALVKALAQEASDVASQFLNVCIRAIDFCPPCDMELGEYLRALITADSEVEIRDKWGFREALMRSFRRRQIFPDHVRFMSEDAVRWQALDSLDTVLQIPELAFSKLKFGGEPGRPADAKELKRQAHALGKFVTDPRRAEIFHLIAPGGKLPKEVRQASPAMVQSVRVSRRAAPDGRILFDLIAEVTQSCTVERAGELFDMNGGCTIVIDPDGKVRYAIYKRFNSDARRTRQFEAMQGPLKAYWKKIDRRYMRQPDVLRRLHADAE